MITNAERVSYRRALEALRNGVPNRDAVKALGCSQPEAERRFLEQLERLDDDSTNPPGDPPGDPAGGPSRQDQAVPGLLVKGGFGTGKSHLLEYFEHLALTNNFVCSRVVISKETPLFNPEKVYLAAVENGVAPDLSGRLIDEIALKLQPRSAGYAELAAWASREGNGVAALFPATLLLHERLNNDPELVQEIVNFWSGDWMPVSRIRQGLRSIGQAHAYNIRAVRARDLATQRFSFALRLIRAAGYRGWVILIDEIELISRYSILQRGRSYAELARWMGQADGEVYPGLVVVGTITDDFAAERLIEGQDRDYVGPRLRARGTDEFNILAARAEAGMRLIERVNVELAEPTDITLGSAYAELRKIHSQAYSWAAPDVPSAPRRATRRMRSYVRRWIHEWDLKRLYPDADVQTEELSIQPAYFEDKDLEAESAPDPASS